MQKMRILFDTTTLYVSLDLVNITCLVIFLRNGGKIHDYGFKYHLMNVCNV